MNNCFGVLSGMGPGQTPAYHALVLPGPDPYQHLQGGGFREVQRQLGSIGDHYSKHPEEMNNINPQFAASGASRGTHAGVASADAVLRDYYITQYGR
jgi:hypothetical protein